ncbi:hypothetical protein F4806DRAFT_495680 [Annulohypoxylon nitens]|nr:hypothetical protein F4806DRAFT_495680 [Annulohypoxylon nitens]
MSQMQNSLEGRRRFGERDMTILEKSDQEQKALREFVSSHDRYSQGEKRALHFDSVVAFNKAWDVALNARGEFEANHAPESTARILLSSSATAYDILQHMDPILRLVKDFGAPYGGMAIGTISFLFTIRDRVAGLKFYWHIYNDDHELDHQLQSKIVHTYDSFISYCIVAIKYYTKGSLRRWTKALFGSPTLEARALEVQKAIVEVRYKGEELLNKNVDAMKEQLASQTRIIEQLRDEQRGNRLLKIKELLNLRGYSIRHESEPLQKYRGDLNVIMEYRWHELESMRGYRLEKFRNHPNFQTWQDSSHSCMLVLAGYNNESVYSDRECWLSSIALDMIESFRKSEESDPYAFYVLGRQEHNLLAPVLSRVILQLLTLNPQVLQNEKQYIELCAELEEYRGAVEVEKQSHNEQENGNTITKLLQKVALRVLNLFEQTRPIWIILDRVDQCKLGKKDDRKKLMKALVHLLEKAAVKVRVLVVVNGWDWRVDKVSDEFGQIHQESVIVHTEEQKTAS